MLVFSHSIDKTEMLRRPINRLTHPCDHLQASLQLAALPTLVVFLAGQRVLLRGIIAPINNSRHFFNKTSITDLIKCHRIGNVLTMNFDFRPFSRKFKPILYKVWLENDGKPLPAGYLPDLESNRPKGCSVVNWTRAAETQALLDKYKTRFPLIHEFFRASNTVPGMRSDMLRYLLIYDRGGIYSDHDVEWRRKRLPTGYDLILWTEFVHDDDAVRKNMETTREYRGDTPEYNIRIANYVFQSTKPRSPLIERGLKLVQERLRKNANAHLSQYGALYTAGPDAWTDNVITGLPDPATLKPFEKCENLNTEWTDRDGERILLLGRQPGRALALHHTHGLWRSAHEKK